MKEEIKPLIKIGEVLKLGVVRFGRDGDPIMVYEGFIIFLKEKKAIELNTLIEVKIIKVLPKFAFAERTEDKWIN